MMHLLEEHKGKICIVGAVILVIAAIMYWRMPKAQDGSDDVDAQAKNRTTAKWVALVGVIVGGMGCWLQYKGAGKADGFVAMDDLEIAEF